MTSGTTAADLEHEEEAPSAGLSARCAVQASSAFGEASPIPKMRHRRIVPCDRRSVAQCVGTKGRNRTMSKNQIVIYQPNETVRLDVRLENETVWLNQGRIGELFGVDRTVVNRHIHNIYKTGELDEPSTCAKIAQVQNEGGRSITRQIPFYNLDMIIAVGYRVNSFAATQFRKWATTILRATIFRRATPPSSTSSTVG